ncbi:MAG: hypothetical protein LAN83_14465 [Acidobacteriia bacterium]|nr:hypothetical protein [Terriglobia bacterium]
MPHKVYATGYVTGRLEANLAAKNCVDNRDKTPQYLGVMALPMLGIGQDFGFRPLARENRSRRELHASKEKGSEEEKETLTVSETIPRTGLESSEEPLKRSTS